MRRWQPPPVPPRAAGKLAGYASSPGLDLAPQVVPHLYPAVLPLPPERARRPYSPAEAGGYLTLAGAQPAAERRMRAAGPICPGPGAGLIRGDLRDARGSDTASRSGGVAVTVPAPDRRRARPLAAALAARLR